LECSSHEPVHRRLGRAPALLAGLVLAGLPGCRGREEPPAPPAGASAQPIDVTSTIAGCDKLDDCDRLCAESGTPGTCVWAGRLYEFGHGVDPDPSRAFRLYEQACASELAGGCYNAAVLLEAGKGVARDPARARRLYAKVCAMGSTTSCERARAVREGGS
jgi:hypothetical protein